MNIKKYLTFEYLIVLPILCLTAFGIARSYLISPPPDKPPQKEKESPDIILFSKVNKVDIEAGGLMSNSFVGLGAGTSPHCILMKALKDKPSGDKDASIINRLYQREKTYCDLSETIRPKLIKNFERLASENKLPENLYVFDVYDEGVEKWETVGAFFELNECKDFYEQVTLKDLGTKPCRMWESKYQLKTSE
jgi:hypothetical protein